MATYSDAIANMGDGIPNLASVRKYSIKTGLVLNAEQSINDYIGWFARISINDGSKEAYDFTEINRSYSSGLVFDGKFWNRADDKVGIAFAVNQLSSEAQQYFKLGGQGILIGDAPHPGYASETIFETFYSARVEKHTTLTLDYQFANNPAYNPARGPINFLAFRAHIEF
jgi:high affinity Mn2+ porin